MRLRSLLGYDAYWIPPRLWAYAAENQPNGDFSGYTAEELANLIGYAKDATSMLQALLTAGFLDEGMKIHDWEEHNGFHEKFAARAKLAAKVRWENERRKDEKRGEEMKQALLEASLKHDPNVKGNGKPPGKFVSELSAQIREANEEIQRLKDSGDPSKKPRIRELCQKRREWREEMLSQ